MRQIRSSGSVKAIFLEQSEVLRRLQEIAHEAMSAFPEILEIRLIGSLSTGSHTGLSDIDLLIVVDKDPDNPIEAMKPYFFFFSRHLNLSLDVLITGPLRPMQVESLVRESVLLSSRTS